MRCSVTSAVGLYLAPWRREPSTHPRFSGFSNPDFPWNALAPGWPHRRSDDRVGVAWRARGCSMRVAAACAGGPGGGARAVVRECTDGCKAGKDDPGLPGECCLASPHAGAAAVGGATSPWDAGSGSVQTATVLWRASFRPAAPTRAARRKARPRRAPGAPQATPRADDDPILPLLLLTVSFGVCKEVTLSGSRPVSGRRPTSTQSRRAPTLGSPLRVARSRGSTRARTAAPTLRRHLR